jgi:hypothetical protein
MTRIAVLLMLAALAALPAGRAAVSPPTYVYALNLGGRVMVNGERLENLKGSFKAEPFVSHREEAWDGLAVEGADRFALRRDGLLRSNGRRLGKLRHRSNEYLWVALAVSGGTAYSLREDGRVGIGDRTGVNLPAAGEPFTDIAAAAGHCWSLRGDGTLFRDEETLPVSAFAAGDGEDGRSRRARWIRVARDPAGEALFGLRADGHIHRLGLPPGPASAAVVRLPFDDDRPHFDAQFYTDLEVIGAASWFALRKDGQVYSEASTASPLVDHRGNGSDRDDAFADLAALPGRFWALRGDGRVYADLDPEPVWNLDRDNYVKIAVSTEPPAGRRRGR